MRLCNVGWTTLVLLLTLFALQSTVADDYVPAQADTTIENAPHAPCQYQRTYINERGPYVERYGNTLSYEQRERIMQRSGAMLDCITLSCTCPDCGEEMRCEETFDDENKRSHCNCPEH